MDLFLDYNEEIFDLKVEGNDLVQDDGLRTAVAISLFSDARATVEELPAGERDRKGWWGDMIAEIDGDRVGSKLWLLRREKHTEETRKRAEEYAKEALTWLVTDKVAQSVDISAEWASRGFLVLNVSIHRPKGKIAFRYIANWNFELARG